MIINSNDGWEEWNQAIWDPATLNGDNYTQANGVNSPALWPDGVAEGASVFYRLALVVPGGVISGKLWASVDDDTIVDLNDTEVLRDQNGFAQALNPVDITSALVSGNNLFEAEAYSTICCGRGFAPYVEITYEPATTVIPEPGTFLAGAMGLAAVALLRRR